MRFKQGLAELVLADCRRVEIPSDSVCITDPPYNIGSPQRVTDVRKKVKYKIGQDFGEAFDTEAISPNEWASCMPDTVISFYGAKKMHHLLNAFENNGYEIIQDFHWCKNTCPPPLRSVGFSWATESGYIFRKKGTRHYVNKKAPLDFNYYVCGPAQHKGKDHPTKKPLALMKWLIHHFTDPGMLVVDPFMGSGSTGVASVLTGRRFLGVELKKEFYQIAKRRVRAALLQRGGSFQFDS